MGSRIEWTDETWNPLLGCRKVSAGCANCYAETMANRLAGMGQDSYRTQVDGAGRWTGRSYLVESALAKPFAWRRKPRRIFVCSMADLFFGAHRDEDIARVLAVVALNPHHLFQVLTKRSSRLRVLLSSESFRWMVWDHAMERVERVEVDPLAWPLGNLALGVSVENERARRERLPDLQAAPAAFRFISLEPLLEAVDLGELEGLDQVIVGGESGPRARPMHPAWVRWVRDQTQAAGVPLLFKQWGAWGTQDPGELELPGGGGTHRPESVELDSGMDTEPPARMWRVGKEHAGRLLDGEEWLQEIPWPPAGVNAER